ncbi:hypothetical protein ACOME3_009624 [Neoechinorhynchus agilis]
MQQRQQRHLDSSDSDSNRSSTMTVTPRTLNTGTTPRGDMTTMNTFLHGDHTTTTTTTTAHQYTVAPEQNDVDILDMQVIALCINAQADMERPTGRLSRTDLGIEPEVALIAGLNKCESSPKAPFISTVDELTSVFDKLRFVVRDARPISHGSKGAINESKFVTAWSLFGAFFYRIWSKYIQCDYDCLYRSIVRSHLHRKCYHNPLDSYAIHQHEPIVATAFENAILASLEGLVSVSEFDRKAVRFLLNIQKSFKDISPIIRLLDSIKRRDEHSTFAYNHEYFGFCSGDSCPSYAFFGSVGLANMFLTLNRNRPGVLISASALNQKHCSGRIGELLQIGT